LPRVAPGFAADCLETLEEIGVENAEYFHAAGGEKFAALPCLNDSDKGPCWRRSRGGNWRVGIGPPQPASILASRKPEPAPVPAPGHVEAPQR
jgi:hypothetical protein